MVIKKCLYIGLFLAVVAGVVIDALFIVGFSITNWFIAIGTIGFLVVAWEGVDTWRTQTVVKRRVELAEGVLKAIYEARDAVNFIRFPTSRLYRPGDIDEEEWRKSYLNPLYRIQYTTDKFSLLEQLEFECKIVFPDTTLDIFRELIKIRNDLRVNAYAIQRYHVLDPELKKKRPSDIESQHPGYEKKLDSLWKQCEESEVVNPLVNKLINEAEEFFRPILEDFYYIN